MKESITFQPTSKRTILQVANKKIRSGDVIKKGDIPDGVFFDLAKRPDFGGDWEAYAKRRGSFKEIAIETPEPKEQTIDNYTDEEI